MESDEYGIAVEVKKKERVKRSAETGSMERDELKVSDKMRQ